MQLLIRNANLVTHETTLKNHWLMCSDGSIEDFGPMESCPEVGNALDAENMYVLPGAIEMHIHGAAGVDAMDADMEYLEKIATHLPRTGSTAFLATTMTAPFADIERALINLADHKYDSGAKLLGVHLEGPFISSRHPGAQNPEHIIIPDEEALRHLQDLSGNRIRLLTYAPEEDDGAFLEALRALDIIPSAGHTDATYDTLKNAQDNGLSHITHLYNGMRGLHHREPGVVGFSYLEQPYVEVIADGVHSRPEMVKLAFDTITPERLIMITDAMRAQGLPDGEYDLGGQTVHVSGNEARLSDGTLAGSVLTMQQAVSNMRDYTGCSWTDIVRMSAYNPAVELGLTDAKGVIRQGADADLVIYDEASNLKHTIINGERVF
ncbi:N-acetylglucosamine-6-phosphate deacetylase [Salinicoccus sp. ID82-1]|uniref:N-acetylglucosamine-6-phosphate deacetylase n=1 Tax=Salinicoccus cyprini TaxID=2493691 RepID=A0A558ATU7_9STAP|nr:MULTISPECIES: N-acetylglucosamine-6-phosphate deacetylase [Salinicoccus]MCG1010825.1 N-acetylglucosamine-6-phosphate deacetylase [Salinicoccus sp. ID82-1]TVT27694.1 N-acetylglucosamine-6-phosphate deacetylase [Salinicoccus cyprini]